MERHEVENGMTSATKDANDRERKSTAGESRFLHSTLCRPNLLSERVVQLKLTEKCLAYADQRNTLRPL